MRRLITLLFAIAACTGCSTFDIDVGRYSVSRENTAALKRLGAQKVAVGKFTASKSGTNEINCSGGVFDPLAYTGPIKTPDRRSFEDYIRQALIDELTVAQLFAESAPITLTGNLNKIDFDSVAQFWIIDLTLTSSNGRSLSVSNKYSYFKLSHGERYCPRTAYFFVPAVQVLLGKVVHDPIFAELLQ
jgi:hypothetical protein